MLVPSSAPVAISGILAFGCLLSGTGLGPVEAVAPVVQGSAQEPSGEDAALGKPAKDLAELVERMRSSERRQDRVRATIEMTQVVDMTGRFDGGRKIDMKSRVRFELLRLGKAGDADRRTLARMRSESHGPAGLSKLEVVRNAEGAFIHEANEMSGESWLHVPPELLARLAKAEAVLGEGGSSELAVGKLQLGSFLGAQLVTGLSAVYELELARPHEIGTAECEHVVGRLKKDAAESGALGQGRPDRVDVYVDRKTLLLRRMVHSLGGNAKFRVEVLELDTVAKELKPADFKLVPSGSASFIDIRKDPFAEAAINSVLERLGEWERQQNGDAAKPGEKKTEEQGDEGK